VPSLRDSTPQAAARLLEGLRLRLSQVDSPAGTPNSGRILDQKPPAGTGVAPGTGVSVTLGPLQPTGVRVPWVVGLPVEQARQVLSAAGFTTLAVDSAESSAAPGNVLTQRPDSGAVVEPVTTVIALTISVPFQVAPPVVPVPEPEIVPPGLPWGPIGLVSLAVLVLAAATQKPLRRGRAEREWKRRIRLEARRDPGEAAVPDLGKPLGEPVVGFRTVANPGSATVEANGDLVREEGRE
jgi:beta-lactam-binding protein with PASTA domain